MFLSLFLCSLSRVAAAMPFQIQVVDDATGRGVPLVELITVSDIQFVTDSAGRVAVFEPAWTDESVAFEVRSHGYTAVKDGFGFPVVRIPVRPNGKAVVRVKRLNVAERLYRVTGEGIYRDSVLLGEAVPVERPLLSAQVVGQDSVQAAIYRGKIHWFWGDTDRLSYPLGNFSTTGAVSDLPVQGGLDPALGINLRYLTNSDGFTKPMCGLGFKEGVVWVDGLALVRDQDGIERMICRYMHMQSLARMLEQGLAMFDDQKQEFIKLKVLPYSERWRFPHNQVTTHREAGATYLYFGYAFPNVRVKAELNALLDPEQYEAWSCLAKTEDEDEGRKVNRDDQGGLEFRWSKRDGPVGPELEQKLLRAGAIQTDETRFLPVDVESGDRIRIHRGSVRWNAHRNRWVFVGNQEGGRSHLGEMWYAEAEEIVGPWRKARRIVTHDKYSFYNPVHHPFFDQDGGRLIYFEGTYTTAFSGNEVKTPRYDYNQIMYRLDLDDERLETVR